MSCLASAAASCAATLACQGCSCLLTGMANTSARVAYCTLFFLSMILSWVLRDFAKPMMEKIPWIVRGYVSSELNSDVWYGEQAVYRISLGNFIFFFGLCLGLIGVTDRSDPRDKLHHGSWHLKFLAWLVLNGLPFLFPNPVIIAYAWVARIGSGLFLVVQMVILLDFAAAWNDSWVSKHSENWLYALLAVTVISYSGSLVVIGFLYHWYGAHKDCSLNTTLITLTLVMALAFSMVSVHPSVKGGSLMPSSLICAYCVYLCFSALSSEPSGYHCNGLANDGVAVSETTLCVGMLITMVSVVYSALRAGSNSQFFQVADEAASGNLQSSSHYTHLMAPTEDPDAIALEPEDADLEDQEMTRASEARPRGPVAYNYAFFHLIFALANMYVAMLMTGWGSGAEEEDRIDLGWTSVWVKIVSQWVTALLYSWTLLAPVVMPDRDF